MLSQGKIKGSLEIYTHDYLICFKLNQNLVNPKGKVATQLGMVWYKQLSWNIHLYWQSSEITDGKKVATLQHQTAQPGTMFTKETYDSFTTAHTLHFKAM